MSEALIFIAVVGVIAFGIFWLVMLYEIATRPDEAYARAGQSKPLWFIVVLVLQFFGTLGYFFMARDKLQAAERELTASSRGELPG